MTAYTKIKLKIFIIDLLFELIINSIIISVAILSGKLLETLCFYLPWRVFRYSVPKIFHVRLKGAFMSIAGCLVFSSLIFILAMKLMLPIGISIFSSIIIGMLINYALYKVQDYIDMKNKLAKHTKDIYSMTEDELRQYAHSKHISE